MKVTKLTTYRLPPRWMFLKIETDEGVTGWGEPVIEGRARSVETAVNELSEYVIGKDPARINDIWQAMYRTGFYRGGPILMSAIAGIDQALWDIKGKVLGAPVYELLGGLVRDRKRLGLWVTLCPWCHQNGPTAIHNNHDADLRLKRWAQKKQGFGRMGEISSSKRKETNQTVSVCAKCC